MQRHMGGKEALIAFARLLGPQILPVSPHPLWSRRAGDRTLTMTLAHDIGPVRVCVAPRISAAVTSEPEGNDRDSCQKGDEDHQWLSGLDKTTPIVGGPDFPDIHRACASLPTDALSDRTEARRPETGSIQSGMISASGPMTNRRSWARG